MRKRAKASFDPKIFLAKVGEGKTISKYRSDQIVFSQGEVADAVFYIQQGKVKLTVVSEQGKEAVVAILGPGHFFGEGCLNWPAPGSEDTEFGVLMEPEVGHGETREVHTRVPA